MIATSATNTHITVCVKFPCAGASCLSLLDFTDSFFSSSFVTSFFLGFVLFYTIQNHTKTSQRYYFNTLVISIRCVD